MYTLTKEKKTQYLICLLIGLSFFWTGSGYLTWLYHLMAVAPQINADFYSEVVGYIFQALGLGIYSLFIRRSSETACDIKVTAAIFLTDFVFICTASLIPGCTAVLLTGFLMNLLHGMVAGTYLTLMMRYLPAMYQARTFGVGYAIGSLGSWILSLVGEDNFLTSGYVHIVYAVLMVFSLFVAHALLQQQDACPDHFSVVEGADSDSINTSVIILACLTVFLLSLVKNVGFYFPMADISAGKINLEFSRLFYAAGLIVAGFINDYNRKYGIVSCLAALVFPFVLLFMTSQSEGSQIIWIISYTFTGFYTVYRILLLGDLIRGHAKLLYLAGFGLLFGRLGDAAGAAIGMLSPIHMEALIWISALLFMATIVIIFLLSERIYHPVVKPDATDTTVNSADNSVNNSEVTGMIITFAQKYELSDRERDIFTLALTDMTNLSISSALFISENTTKFHIRNILKKTGCANRKELKELFRKTK